MVALLAHCTLPRTHQQRFPRVQDWDGFDSDQDSTATSDLGGDDALSLRSESEHSMAIVPYGAGESVQSRPTESQQIQSAHLFSINGSHGRTETVVVIACTAEPRTPRHGRRSNRLELCNNEAQFSI